MKRHFLTVLLVVMVLLSRSQTVEDLWLVPGCKAMYSAAPEPQDPLTLHFQDQSTGQITSWQWSFGDGSTSTMQNPVHTYVQGGTYFVCLTVSNTSTGVSCHDVLCLAITIHEPGKCIADYEFLPDLVNPLMFHFSDKSSGNVNRWHWSFGDGTFSDERSPDHTFPSDGKFPVCLTAYHADSISVCHDVKCDSIQVNPVPQCHAAFSVFLDSLNPHPFTYIFTSTSTGNPNHFQWDMGDGTVYDSPSCTHTYQFQGSYDVCLHIQRKEGLNIVCSDSLCSQISTEKYFDMGGHLFIGEHPINNPISTGDTGVVSLFRKRGSELILIRKNNFTYLGYYAFPKILNGEYLVKAGLTNGSIHFKDYIPAYYPSALKWQEAGDLHLFDSNDYNTHVILVKAEKGNSGPGKITGKVVLGEPGISVSALPDAEVVLYNNQLKPITFNFTDQMGSFLFDHIAYGSYYLYVEFPGLFSRLTPVWIDVSVPVADSILLGAFDHDVTGIPPAAGTSFQAGPLFPNPARDHFNLEVTTPKKMSVSLKIVDLFGNILLLKDKECASGKNLFSVPLNGYKQGVYVVSLRTNGEGEVKNWKLLVF